MSTDERQKPDEKQKTDQEPDRENFRGLHAEITGQILGVFFDVYNELGGGFLESVYQGALRVALIQAGLRVASEVAVPVYFAEKLWEISART
jgi:hypothetical protein